MRVTRSEKHNIRKYKKFYKRKIYQYVEQSTIKTLDEAFVKASQATVKRMRRDSYHES